MYKPRLFLDGEDLRSKSVLRLVDIVLFVCASILIGRSIPQRETPAFDWVTYAHGGIKMPFQARYLMAPVLRLAHGSAAWTSVAHVLENSAQSPEQLALQIVDVSGILVAGYVTTKLRRQFAPKPILDWLPKWILMWIVAVTFVTRYEQALYLPYDLPSLAIFSVGLLFAVTGASVPFVMTVILGTYNRETTVFLVPVWLMLHLPDQTRRVRIGVAGLTAVVGSLLVKAQIYHWLSASSTGLEIIVDANLRTLLPHHLPQTLSVGGYLLWPILLLWRSIADRRIQRIWVALIPFAAAALTVGLWNETRIFGELSVLVACTAAVLLETTIAHHCECHFLRNNPVNGGLVDEFYDLKDVE